MPTLLDPPRADGSPSPADTPALSPSPTTPPKPGASSGAPPTRAAVRTSRVIARAPGYFGWFVAAAATLALGLTLPGQTAGVSLFIERFVADLGLSRQAVSSAYAVATILAALTLPWTGRALDRFGPRRGVLVIGVLFAGAVASMSLVSGIVTLFAGFFLLRALGQGALSLASLHVVNLWFVRRRGLAVGVLGLGLAGTMAVGPPLFEAGIAAVGWRTTYVLVGAALLVTLVPLGALFFRRHPETYGLRPDGPHPAGDAADEVGNAVEAAFTLPEARRTGIFWVLMAGLASTSMIGTGLLFHHVALVEAGGLGSGAAALFFAPFGIATALASLGAGALIDRFGPRRVLAGGLLLFAAMTVAVPLVQTTARVIAYGVAFGVTQGVMGNLGGSAFAYYFGRAHVGAIKGFTKTLGVAATALGPPALAFGAAAFEGTALSAGSGGYAPTLALLALVPFGIALAALRPSIDRPRA